MVSVIIPARDEAESIVSTLTGLTAVLRRENIAYEILIVDDGSTDNTRARALEACAADPCIRLIDKLEPHGFGFAVRAALPHCTGGAVAIVMADGSDSPQDLVTYYRKFEQTNSCVFGSRFIGGGRVIDYPKHKLVVNRLANWSIKVLFGIRYNDVTNAFKCYSREAIEHMQPLISPHFNLTVEMPLKVIVRKYPYVVVPITWKNRKTGVSKLKIKEMGSRYLFIVLYLWLEKILSRGDYHRAAAQETISPPAMRRRAASPPGR